MRYITRFHDQFIAVDIVHPLKVNPHFQLEPYFFDTTTGKWQKA